MSDGLCYTAVNTNTWYAAVPDLTVPVRHFQAGSVFIHSLGPQHSVQICKAPTSPPFPAPPAPGADTALGLHCECSLGHYLIYAYVNTYNLALCLFLTMSFEAYS